MVLPLGQHLVHSDRDTGVKDARVVNTLNVLRQFTTLLVQQEGK